METKALPMQDGIVVRETTVDDIREIVRHRRAMFEDMGVGDSASLDRMESASGPYIEETIAQDCYRGWFAVTALNQIAGGVGILLQSSPPRPWEVRFRRAYLLNLYVYPEYRRRGIARLLTETSVEWCRREGFVTVSLHASDRGRPLYESLGFEPTNEMRLKLE
jgi:GNAT superfamily N-acetyltransferase